VLITLKAKFCIHEAVFMGSISLIEVVPFIHVNDAYAEGEVIVHSIKDGTNNCLLAKPFRWMEGLLKPETAKY
jgi:hypothetical protein